MFKKVCHALFSVPKTYPQSRKQKPQTKMPKLYSREGDKKEGMVFDSCKMTFHVVIQPYARQHKLFVERISLDITYTCISGTKPETSHTSTGYIIFTAQNSFESSFNIRSNHQ